MVKHTSIAKTALKMILGDAFGNDLVSEYRFHHERKFRFDWCVPDRKLAFEFEGGVWIRGAHNRPLHFTSDCEKYNLAQLYGYAVYRFTSDMVKSGLAYDTIKLCKECHKKVHHYKVL